MREVIVGAIALILGVVLGGLLPRAEVRRLEGEIAVLQDKECRPQIGSELSSLFMRPPIPEPYDDEPEDVVEPVQPAPDAVTPDDAPPEEAEVVVAGGELETAKTALRLRQAQARAALVEDAGPDEGQMETFDAAVDDMNADLHDLAEEMVEKFGAGGQPTRHEAMIFAADALDVVITAEDRMTESLDEEQRNAVDEEALDPFSYIDPALLDLLSELDE